MSAAADADAGKGEVLTEWAQAARGPRGTNLRGHIT